MATWTQKAEIDVWAVDSLAFSQDGAVLAAGTDKGTIAVWDLDEGATK